MGHDGIVPLTDPGAAIKMDKSRVRESDEGTMRSLTLALLFVISMSSSGLPAQGPKDAPPCTLSLGSPIDWEVVITTCTQLIESGKVSGRSLARAYLTRIFARMNARTRTIDHSQMIAEATAVIENDPQEGLAYMYRLGSYLETGDYEGALRDATKYIELDPGDWNALNVRSSVYVSKGDFERALADDTKAVEMAPKNAIAYANRAGTYLKAGRKTEALSDLNQALALPLRYPDHHYQRGKILEEMGRTEEAIDDYRSALRLQNELRLEPNNHLQYREALKRLGAVP